MWPWNIRKIVFEESRLFSKTFSREQVTRHPLAKDGTLGRIRKHVRALITVSPGGIKNTEMRRVT